MRKPAIYLILVFVISRVVFIALGIRFDVSPLNHYIQYIDPELLQHDLLRSLFFLHSQPLLFNLFLGVVLKIFPHSYTLAFQVSFLIFGMILFMSLYALMVELNISKKVACILTCLFIINPSTVLYELFRFSTPVECRY